MMLCLGTMLQRGDVAWLRRGAPVSKLLGMVLPVPRAKMESNPCTLHIVQTSPYFRNASQDNPGAQSAADSHFFRWQRYAHSKQSCLVDVIVAIVAGQASKAGAGIVASWNHGSRARADTTIRARV